jgi:beta-lactam-binding protein with PASTA domain
VRFRRQVPWAARSEPREEPKAAPNEAGPEPEHRSSLLATVASRRLIRDVLIVGATFGVGYVIASAWLSPVPLLTRDHAVPRVLDLPTAEAQQKLGELGFRAKLEDERPHPTAPRGAIVWQDPAPGTILPQHSVVTLVPSAGLQQVPVPDIVGLAMPYAGRVLAAAGLKVGEVDTVASDPEPNIVVATRPAAGGGRDPGGAVDIVVSGQPKVRTSQSARIVSPLITGARR